MNFISKIIRFGLLYTVVCAPVQRQLWAADSAPSVTPTGRTEETNSTDLLRAYLQLQEQVHATQMAIERNRQEADQVATRAAEGLNGRLKAIEDSLGAQRNGELQAVQNSNHLMLMLAGMFATVALVAMLVMAVFQWRTINRLAEISAQASAGGFAFASGKPMAALGAGESHSVTISPAEQSQGQGGSSAGLLNAVERLEKRVNELEHTAHPPLQDLKAEAGPADSGYKTGAEPHEAKIEMESASVPEQGKSGGMENGASQESTEDKIFPNGPSKNDSEHATEPATSTEAGRITGLLGKGQSLLNVDKAEEALACFDEVLMLDARNAEALVKKGTALERLRKLDEAIECYDRAIAADSSMTIAYLYKGGLFNRLERFTEAMECYEKALRTQEKGQT